MIVPVKDEPIIRSSNRGNWEYCRDTETGWRGYRHIECDALANREGYCVACGAPCPTLWTEGNN